MDEAEDNVERKLLEFEELLRGKSTEYLDHRIRLFETVLGTRFGTDIMNSQYNRDRGADIGRPSSSDEMGASICLMLESYRRVRSERDGERRG